MHVLCGEAGSATTRKSHKFTAATCFVNQRLYSVQVWCVDLIGTAIFVICDKILIRDLVAYIGASPKCQFN
jgi:hypothetical protein